MSTVLSLVAKLGLDADAFKKGMDEAEKTAKAKGGGIQGLLSNIGKGLGKAAVGIAVGGIGVVTAAVAGLGVAGQAAAEEQVGIEALGQAVRNTGADWGIASDAIEGYLSSELKRTALDDGAGRDAIARLTEITGDYTETLKLMPLVQDLAAAKGMDLASAAQLVGRVSAGNTSILSRYGVVLGEGASATEALAAMQEKFGGQAETFANTNIGKQQKLSIALGNLKETLGGLALGPMAWFAEKASDLAMNILPKVEGAIGWLTDVVNTVKDAFLGLGDGGFAPFSEALQKLGVPPGIAEGLQWLADTVSSMIYSFQEWGGSGVAGIIDGVVAALASLVSSATGLDFTAIMAGWETFKSALGQVGDYITSTIVPAFNTFIGFVQANAIPILAGLGAALLTLAYIQITAAVPAAITHISALLGQAAAAWAAAAAFIAMYWPVLAIGVAVAALALAWKNDWGGIRTFMTEFWNNTLKPIIDQIVVWFQTNIPIAIATLSGFWTNTLLPAIQAVGNWITGTLVPIFQEIWNWLSTNIPVAIAAVSGFWTNTLLPAIQAVAGFFTGTLFPLLSAIVDVYFAAWSLVLTVVAGLWQNVLLPALQAVGGWIADKLVPALQSAAEWLGDKLQIALKAVGGFINDTIVPAVQSLVEWFQDKLVPAATEITDKVETGLNPALEWLKDKLLEPLKTALGTMGDKIQDVTKFFQGFADKLDALKGRLPAWLTPGSPTPLENGLVGIGEAMVDVIDQFVKFGSTLKGKTLDNLNRFGLAVRDIAKTLKDLASAFHQMNKVEKTEGGIPSLGLWADALKQSIIRFSLAITEAAKIVKTSTINNARELAVKIEQIFELLRTLGSVLSDLSQIKVIPDMAPFGVALQQAIVVTATAINNAALTLGEKALKAAAKLSDEAQQIIALIGPACQALASIADLKPVADLETKAGQLSDAINIFLNKLNYLASLWANTGLDAAVTFAQSAQAIIALVGPAVQALAAFVEFPAVTDLEAKANTLNAAINVFLNKLNYLALQWAGTGLGDAVKFSEAAQKVVALVGPAVQALAAMVDFPAVQDLEAKAGELANSVNTFLNKLNYLAGRWVGTGLEDAVKFSEAAQKIVALIKPAVDALAAIATYAPVQSLATLLVDFQQQLYQVVEAVVSVSRAFGAEAVTAAGVFAGSVTTIANMIKPAVDALGALAGYTPVKGLLAAIQNFSMDLYDLIDEMVFLAGQFNAEGVAAAAAFAGSVNTIVGMIKPALDAIAALVTYKPTKGFLETIQNFSMDLYDLVDELVFLAGQFNAEGVAAAAVFATAVNTIVSIVKPGLDTIKALLDYKSSKKLAPAVDAFGLDLYRVVQALVSVGLAFGVEAVAAAVTFSTAVGQIVTMVKAGIETIGTLAKYTAQKGLTTGLEAFQTQFGKVLEALKAITQNPDYQTVPQTFIELATGVAEAVEQGVGAVTAALSVGAGGGKGDPTTQVKGLTTAMDLFAKQMKTTRGGIVTDLSAVASALGTFTATWASSWANIANAMNSAISKLRTFKAELKSLVIPDALEGHSPPPLANWMAAIADATKDATAQMGNFAQRTEGTRDVSVSVPVGPVTINNGQDVRELGLFIVQTVRNALATAG